jgi:uncharacterized membrane protein YjdF
LRIIGSYVAFAAVSILLWRFPLSVQISFLTFVLLASSLGSVLEFYAVFNYFDKFVHYLSGIVLAFAGFYIAKILLNKREIADNGDFLKNTIAFLFSCSCAAFWEIYEFTVDNLLGMESQGNNQNTMGDIVAGVLGAVTYLALYIVINRKKICNKR